MLNERIYNFLKMDGGFNMYKVSVIMPIYNAEEYLKNTLNSVINQTIGFENMELIVSIGRKLFLK